MQEDGIQSTVCQMRGHAHAAANTKGKLVDMLIRRTLEPPLWGEDVWLVEMKRI